MDEREYPDGGEPRLGEWKDDSREHLEAGRPSSKGRLLEIDGDGLKVRGQHPQTERERERHVGQDETGIGVGEPEAHHRDEQRDDEEDLREDVAISTPRVMSSFPRKRIRARLCPAMALSATVSAVVASEM